MAGQAFGALGFLMAGATTTANVTGTNTTTLPSDIAGSAGLTKIGTGTLVLAGANTYTGATTLSAGTILVTGSTAASSAVSVASGATLAGNGTIHGTVDIAGGGTLSPGNSPGLINTGTLTMAAGSTLAMDISGTTPGSGYDQVKVTGAVNLGATLALNVSGLVAGSQSFILIDNDGADPVIGTFSGLPEGATVSAGGMSFRITYAGGDGNDVVIRSGADCSTRAIAPLAPGVERLPYNQALVMEGSVGAVTWTLSGALPSGITFGRGVLSGTPTMRGAFALQATATDSVGCEASAALALSISAARRIVAGTGSGDATVRAFNLSGTAPVTSFHVHDAGFTGGVSVAQADTNSDGVPDVITGAGPGGSPTIGVFDGATNALRASFFAFDPAFRGGVEVAAGDVTGDGIPEILAVPGCGGPPVVRAFNAQTGALVREYPVGAPGSCGLHLAAADVTGDGIADLVVGAGPGGLPVVTVIDGVSGTTLRHFLAYADVFSGGVYVAAADLTGDGVPDIVTGAGPGGGPHVRVFDGATGREVRGFFAYDPVFGGGVRVAAGDLDGDGKAEVITAAGPGGGPHVRIFDGATGTERLGLLAFDPSFTGGVFVGAAAPLGRMTVDGAARTIGTGIRIAGWALREGGSGVGTDAIHAWAYPAGGGAPVFVGATTARVARSDVAAVFGGEFLIAGFDFTGTLAPGTYDLVVFARNSVTGNFDQWRVLRVTVN
jgi:autotransporter-associated beta strand protein